MASYAVQDGILCCTRWHLMLYKMASYVTQDVILFSKRLKDTEENFSSLECILLISP